MINLYRKEIDTEKYIIARYHLETSKDLKWAAWQLSTGQSFGNPNVRNQWETNELFENHACIIMHDEYELIGKQRGTVEIAFPLANFDLAEDGITQILTSLFGGQLDIKSLDKCILTDIVFPSHVMHNFKGPKYGITGLREKTKVHNKPLLLGIMKPKILTSAAMLRDMASEMIEGGCNLIKEDEIHSNPACLPLKERVKIIAELLKGTDVVFFHTVNCDQAHLLDRAKYIADNGGNGMHVNFWAGLGSYKSIRDLDLPLALHFQTSGSKILCDRYHRYSISWPVICQLAGMAGVDMAHVGMIGGYGNYDENETLDATAVLRYYNVLPSYSCGMTPGNIHYVTKQIGIDYAVGIGGSLHGHNFGTKAGAKACIQAINGTGGIEYDEGIRQWGLKS